MKGLPRLILAAALATVHPAGAAVAAPADDAAAVRLEFIAAMQRLQLPTSQTIPASAPPDSQALRSYAIYDYLIAARLRRDLDLHPGDELDAAIDTFLAAHVRQPVSRALRHDWLANLAERRRWDWFLPRSTDVADPSLICDRLQARLETGDLKGLGPDVMVRWNLPQKQPRECDGVFAWLRQQGLISPALAEVRTRAALAAENPRLAREFAADLGPAAAAPLLQWAQLLENSKFTLNALAANPGAPVETDALDAGVNRLARSAGAQRSGDGAEPAAAITVAAGHVAGTARAPRARCRTGRSLRPPP
jgi:soluble lytic murein transglycosylase